MSGAREPNRPPVLVRFAVGALAKGYEDIRSWSEQVRDDVARIPDELKKIPTNLAALPVQYVTDAVSSALRLQQNFTALVIKGDETLDLIFHKPEEKPAWATFDEDEDDEIPAPSHAEAPKAAPVTPITPAPRTTGAAVKPETAKPAAPKAERSPVSKPAAAKPSAAKPSAPKPAASRPPTPPKPTPPKPSPPKDLGPPKAAASAADRPELVEYLGYESASLAQLRARARNLSIPELRELLAFERATGNRPPFITLLENRITSSGS